MDEFENPMGDTTSDLDMQIFQSAFPDLDDPSKTDEECLDVMSRGMPQDLKRMNTDAKKIVRSLACPICKTVLNNPKVVPNGTPCEGGHCYIDNIDREWGCVQCGQRFCINGSWTAVAGRHFDATGICTKLSRAGEKGKNTLALPPQAPPAAQGNNSSKLEAWVTGSKGMPPIHKAARNSAPKPNEAKAKTKNEMNRKSPSNPSATKKCFECMNADAVMYCQDCSAYLCMSCNSCIHNIFIFRTHTQVPITNMPGNAPSPPSAQPQTFDAASIMGAQPQSFDATSIPQQMPTQTPAQMPTTQMPTTQMPTTQMPTTQMPTTQMPTQMAMAAPQQQMVPPAGGGVVCSQCAAPATMACLTCNSVLCASCDGSIHQFALHAGHIRLSLPLPPQQSAQQPGNSVSPPAAAQTNLPAMLSHLTRDISATQMMNAQTQPPNMQQGQKQQDSSVARFPQAAPPVSEPQEPPVKPEVEVFPAFPPRGECSKQQLVRLARRPDTVPLFNTPAESGNFQVFFSFDNHSPVPLQFTWESPRAVQVLLPSYLSRVSPVHAPHTTKCDIVMFDSRNDAATPLQWVYWYDHDDTENKVAVLEKLSDALQSMMNIDEEALQSIKKRPRTQGNDFAGMASGQASGGGAMGTVQSITLRIAVALHQNHVLSTEEMRRHVSQIQETLGLEYWGDIARAGDMHLAAIFLEQLQCYTHEAGEAASRLLLDSEADTLLPDVILATTKVLASLGEQECSSSTCCGVDSSCSRGRLPIAESSAEEVLPAPWESGVEEESVEEDGAVEEGERVEETVEGAEETVEDAEAMERQRRKSLEQFAPTRPHLKHHTIFGRQPRPAKTENETASKETPELYETPTQDARATHDVTTHVEIAKVVQDSPHDSSTVPARPAQCVCTVQ